MLDARLKARLKMDEVSLRLGGARPVSGSPSSGKCDMPHGGCTVFDRLGVEAGVSPITVLLRRRPSHSMISFSPGSEILSSFFSSRYRRASFSSTFRRELEIRRAIAAVPRMASAFGSVSGSSCSATSRTWSRSPLKTAASGTSLADLESCSNTTPQQICKKPKTTVVMVTGVPLKPWNNTAEVMMVALVKIT